MTDRQAIKIIGEVLRDHWENHLKKDTIFDPTKGDSELEQAWNKILWLLYIYNGIIK
jgi:hypothetical protein